MNIDRHVILHIIGSKFSNKIANPISRYFFLGSLILSLSAPSDLIGQYQDNYTPIGMVGTIPEEFLNSCNKSTSILFKINDKNVDEQQYDFNTIMQFKLRELFVSGNIYFNDECTNYVQEVVDYILQFANLDLNVNAFVSRFDDPSATVWQDGTIIVNIGLLEKLENESQLAFVIAHELGHLIKQHQYKQYIHQQSLKAIQRRALDNQRSQLQYSQQNEYEADGFAFNLLRDSKYDLKEAINVFEILENLIKDSNTQVGLNLSSIRYPILENNLCGKGDYGTFMSPSRLVATPENEMRIFQRKKQFKKQLTNGSFIGDQKFVVSEQQFNNVKTIARFELIENSFNESDFLKSLSQALSLMEEFPKNRYLQIKAAENLYYIGYYNKHQQIEQLFFENNTITDPTLASIYCLTNRYAESGLSDLVHGYIEDQYSKFEEEEIMIITMAKSSELFQNKTSAIPYYEKYISLFPKGKHAIFALEKINSKSSF